MNLKLPTYNLDYQKVITGYGNFTVHQQDKDCAVDQTIISKKLAIWDYVVNSGILTPPEKDQHGHYVDIEQARRYWSAVLLLKDRSIYAYQNFRFNGKPLKLRWYQDLMLNDKHKRILFAASNQIGKSLTLDVDAAVEFSIDHSKEWVGILVSKSLAQSQFQMDRIKQLLRTGNFDYRVENTNDTKTGKKDNSFQITYTFYDAQMRPKYTNRLICSPPTGSALGYPADVLWLDEFDFWKDIDQHWFIYQIAIPRTFETKGSIKIFTNPDGKKELWELWNQRDVKGNYVWHRYNFNFWDKPDVTQEEFDLNSAGMTRREIESTLLAIFSDSENSWFTYKEIIGSEDKELNISSMLGKQPFFFLDVGAKHDQSILVGGYVEPDPENEKLRRVYIPIIQEYPVGYPLSRVVGSKVDDSDGWHYVKSVKEYLEEWSQNGVNPVFGVDATGNSGIIPLFHSADVYPIDVQFSGPVKSGMYQRFKYFMEKGLLHRIPNKKWVQQAMTLRVKKSARGYFMIHHEKEDDLDDMMDATAGLIYLADNPVIVEPSMTII